MRPPEVPEQPVTVLRQEQLGALLRSCQGKEFVNRRDLAIIYVFMDAGVRRAELAGLEPWMIWTWIFGRSACLERGAGTGWSQSAGRARSPSTGICGSGPSKVGRLSRAVAGREEPRRAHQVGNQRDARTPGNRGRNRPPLPAHASPHLGPLQQAAHQRRGTHAAGRLALKVDGGPVRGEHRRRGSSRSRETTRRWVISSSGCTQSQRSGPT